MRDKKRVAKDLLPIISKIGDLIEQDFWLKKLADKAIISYEILREQLKKIGQKEKKEDEKPEMPKMDQENLIQERFIGLLLKFPDQVSSFYEELSEDLFSSTKLKIILRELKKKYGLATLENDKITPEELKVNIDSEEIKSYLDFLTLAIEKDQLSFDKKFIDKELEFLFKRIKKNFITRKLQELEKELIAAEKEKNKEKIKEISQKIATTTQGLKECS